MCGVFDFFSKYMHNEKVLSRCYIVSVQKPTSSHKTPRPSHSMPLQSYPSALDRVMFFFSGTDILLSAIAIWCCLWKQKNMQKRIVRMSLSYRCAETNLNFITVFLTTLRCPATMGRAMVFSGKNVSVNQKSFMCYVLIKMKNYAVRMSHLSKHIKPLFKNTHA